MHVVCERYVSRKPIEPGHGYNGCGRLAGVDRSRGAASYGEVCCCERCGCRVIESSADACYSQGVVACYTSATGDRCCLGRCGHGQATRRDCAARQSRGEAVG